MSGPRCVFLMGATATGKSEWALRLAVEAKARIFNCDSVQVYSELQIGSGLPSPSERELVPHHLYAYVQPPAEMNAGQFRKDFFQEMASLGPDEKILVVGGTGFYFQAIEKGMFPVPAVPEEISVSVRDEIKAQGPEALWRELHSKDPVTAQRLAPEDSYRIARAVELCRLGVIPSELRESFTPEPFPHPLLKTFLFRDREELRGRIRRRVKGMIEQGLRDEVRVALDRGWREWAPLQSVGYKETVLAIDERRDDSWLLDEICLRTGQLAKRQDTWFKKDSAASVFQRDEDFPEFRDRVLRFWDAAGRLGST